MLDALIATIHPEDGSARDVCKAFVPKFKEPNAIVIKGRTDTTALVRVNFGGVCHQKFESTSARAISPLSSSGHIAWVTRCASLSNEKWWTGVRGIFFVVVCVQYRRCIVRCTPHPRSSRFPSADRSERRPPLKAADRVPASIPSSPPSHLNPSFPPSKPEL